MQQDIQKVIITEGEIHSMVRALAHRIQAEHNGETLHVVAIYDGSILFLADLIRHMSIPLRLYGLRAKSYFGGTQSTGRVEISGFDPAEVRGQPVLLVDDILDTGLTLHAVRRQLEEAGAMSVKTCVFLCKERIREVPVEADYHCRTIPDEFVVGYGLDYRGLYRNLPFVGILKREVYLP
ncbi:MAG: hypoxanthine phosphoribosyltransferase [Verrucomicrobiae bacterium]|nr:hypoxanthine phosphoribosyltransferase [Verrucomicrobiae bacterium]